MIELLVTWIGVMHMSDALKTVLDNMEQLTPSEKALAAHCLLSSLEGEPSNDVESVWLALAEDRSNALLSGDVKAVSWEEIKAQVVK